MKIRIGLLISSQALFAIAFILPVAEDFMAYQLFWMNLDDLLHNDYFSYNELSYPISFFIVCAMYPVSLLFFFPKIAKSRFRTVVSCILIPTVPRLWLDYGAASLSEIEHIGVPATYGELIWCLSYSLLLCYTIRSKKGIYTLLAFCLIWSTLCIFYPPYASYDY